ncbi:cytochrome c biogenesis CcdA family protein [Aquipuribacter nitratireducens]|uniref:Cytochrome c biogenesis CcdA family protein n=1 Tax=Aquipuribacter nitratireducens TaxID=650104 RepID=A0ABW0GQ38_9MICO
MGIDVAALSLALAAGAVAAVNPCGFALLPAYVTLAVTGDDDGAVSRSRAIGRALRFTAGMTVGFVLVFAAFALLLAGVSSALQQVLPYLTVLMGVALVGVGVWLMAGRALPGLPRVAGGRLGGAPGRGFGSVVGYGVTFALVSLSCTIGPFLAVVFSSLSVGGYAGVVVSFVVYAAGMGAVVGVLALSVALAQAQVVRAVRRAGRVLPRVAGGLVLLAGLYVAWYGWFELRVLAGTTTSDPVVDRALAVQGALTRLLQGAGPTAVYAVAAGVVVLAAVTVLTRRSRRTRGSRRAEPVL